MAKYYGGVAKYRYAYLFSLSVLICYVVEPVCSLSPIADCVCCTYRAAEGRAVRVPYRGPVEGTVQEILGGVRSTCTYVGTAKLKDLPKCTTFVRVTQQLNPMFGPAPMSSL